MVLFRPLRALLADAMAEVREIESLVDMLAFARDKLRPWGVNVSAIWVQPYGDDDRTGWNTHIVTVPDYGVFGFTDGPFEDAVK